MSEDDLSCQKLVKKSWSWGETSVSFRSEFDYSTTNRAREHQATHTRRKSIPEWSDY